MIKTFQEYEEQGTIKKISPDSQRAKNLQLEAQRKFTLLQKQITQLSINDENANDYVEYCYNILMIAIRSKMLKEGYNSSGKGAHEAEVSFVQKLKFSEAEIEILNKLRFFRNGILYYGKQFDKEYAEKIIVFTKKIYKKLVT
jgi:hypothetical protein